MKLFVILVCTICTIPTSAGTSTSRPTAGTTTTAARTTTTTTTKRPWPTLPTTGFRFFVNEELRTMTNEGR